MQLPVLPYYGHLVEGAQPRAEPLRMGQDGVLQQRIVPLRILLREQAVPYSGVHRFPQILDGSHLGQDIVQDYSVYAR